MNGTHFVTDALNNSIKDEKQKKRFLNDMNKYYKKVERIPELQISKDTFLIKSDKARKKCTPKHVSEKEQQNYLTVVNMVERKIIRELFWTRDTDAISPVRIEDVITNCVIAGVSHANLKIAYPYAVKLMTQYSRRYKKLDRMKAKIRRKYYLEFN